MKDYAKVGNRAGMPGYRTRAMFRYTSYLKVQKGRSASKAKQARAQPSFVRHPPTGGVDYGRAQRGSWKNKRKT